MEPNPVHTGRFGAVERDGTRETGVPSVRLDERDGKVVPERLASPLPAGG